MAGRKVEFISADTGGNPAGAKTKAQELVERDKVDVIVGPLAAFELLAITDYIAQAKTPLLSLAAAEDLTQRRPNPYFMRASATSVPVHAPDGGLRRQGTEAQAHHHHLRGLRLRLRADGRLPADLRGQRRQDRQEAVAADGHARLHALPRADRRLRRRLPGLCRIESAAIHEAIRRCRLQVPGASPARPAATTRCCKSFGDEARRHRQLRPLHARSRDRRQQDASSRPCSKDSMSIPGQLCRAASTSTATWSRRRSKALAATSDDKASLMAALRGGVSSPTRRAGRSSSIISAT